MGLTMQDVPVSERPRERLRRLGITALAHQELLACVLGRGVRGESVLATAGRLLQQFGSLAGVGAASLQELAAIHGIGPAKAAQLVAAFALGRAAETPVVEDGTVIADAAAAWRVAAPRLQAQPTEQVIALLLDTRHRLIRVADIAAGSLAACLVHPREVFHEAIRARAAALIVAHNHPSGDPTPSDEDLALTTQLVHAGQVVGIPVLDHVIIGRQRHVSLAQEGALG